MVACSKRYVQLIEFGFDVVVLWEGVYVGRPIGGRAHII